MQYKLSNNGGNLGVSLDGTINFSSNEDFRRMLTEIMANKPTRVVFDLSKLTGIDSVGLGLLYIAQEDLSSINVKLALSHPKDSVARLLELTEANKTFEIIVA